MNRATRRIMARAEKRANHPDVVRKHNAQHYRAASIAPLNPDAALHMQAYALAALDDIIHGRGREQDVYALAAVINVAERLALRGYGLPELPDIRAGQAAVMACLSRFSATGRIGLAGPELLAIRQALDLHAQQLEAGIPGGVVMDAIGEARAASGARV